MLSDTYKNNLNLSKLPILPVSSSLSSTWRKQAEWMFGWMRLQSLSLTVCCVVQHRRVEQEEGRREPLMSEQFLAWQPRRHQLRWAPVKACYTCHQQPCASAFYRDSVFTLAAATPTAARTAKVAWMQSCRRTHGTTGPTDRHTLTPCTHFQYSCWFHSCELNCCSLSSEFSPVIRVNTLNPFKHYSEPNLVVIFNLFLLLWR